MDTKYPGCRDCKYIESPDDYSICGLAYRAEPKEFDAYTGLYVMPLPSIDKYSIYVERKTGKCGIEGKYFKPRNKHCLINQK